MTQDELKNKIFKLIVCSSNLGYLISNQLLIGSDCKEAMNRLFLLNDYINLLLKYNLNIESKNCLTEKEFQDIYDNSTGLCKICECK